MTRLGEYGFCGRVNANSVSGGSWFARERPKWESGERDVWFERLAVRKEEIEVRSILVGTDINLEVVSRSRAPLNMWKVHPVAEPGVLHLVSTTVASAEPDTVVVGAWDSYKSIVELSVCKLGPRGTRGKAF